MNRSLLIVATTTSLLLFASASYCQDPPSGDEARAAKGAALEDAPRPVPPGTRAVPGSGRAATPGLEAVICLRLAPGTRSIAGLEECLRLQRANDRAGIDQMVAAGEVIRLAAVVHAVAAFVLIVGIIVHIYAALWVKGSVGAMVRGTVTYGWARKHHPKWFRESVK